MIIDQNSFLQEWPFFANKQITFAKLSQTPCLSFAEPMLSNNSLYEDSLITCQITPNCHGSLLHSLVNVQLASRNPLLRTGCCWLGNFYTRLTGPPPSKWTLTFAHSFAELLRNLHENTPIHRPQTSAGGASEEKKTPGALVFGSRRASLLEASLLRLELASWDFRKQR